MSPRSAIVGAFVALLFAPQLAEAVATPVRAQTFSPAPPDLSGYVTKAQADATYTNDATLNTDASAIGFATRMGALGAVATSVNGAAGAVTVPTFSRRFSNVPVSTSTGAATFTFSPAFPGAIVPTCFSDVAATNTGYVFLAPVITSISTSAVSYTITAMPKTLTINTLGLATPLTSAPPAGTTLNVTCIAPNN